MGTGFWYWINELNGKTVPGRIEWEKIMLLKHTHTHIHTISCTLHLQDQLKIGPTNDLIPNNNNTHCERREPTNRTYFPCFRGLVWCFFFFHTIFNWESICRRLGAIKSPLKTVKYYKRESERERKNKRKIHATPVLFFLAGTFSRLRFRPGIPFGIPTNTRAGLCPVPFFIHSWPRLSQTIFLFFFLLHFIIFFTIKMYYIFLSMTIPSSRIYSDIFRVFCPVVVMLFIL